MHLLLTGPTGLIGNAVLTHILSLPPALQPVSKLTLLTRSPIPVLPPRHPDAIDGKPVVETIIHTDYARYDREVLERLRDVNGVVWAQGISTMEVSDPVRYGEITKVWPGQFVKAVMLAQRENTGGKEGKLRFVYVSGEGATHQPGRLTQLFARVKGEAELELAGMVKGSEEGEGEGGMKKKKLLEVVSARPGGVLPETKEGVEGLLRKRGFLMRTFMKGVLPLYRTFNEEMLIHTRALGKALTDLATGEAKEKWGEKGWEKKGFVVRNTALRELGGEAGSGKKEEL